LLLRSVDLAWLGVIAFAGGALFALATLPVELNASSRARALVAEAGLAMGEDERRGVNAMLNAAAFTYVAALATAALQLLYYVPRREWPPTALAPSRALLRRPGSPPIGVRPSSVLLDCSSCSYRHLIRTQ
jgi:hypothetical protein